MLVTLGNKEKPETLVGLLLECHTRIRHFTDVAMKLGSLGELPPEEVSDGCARCLRYFREALPLHVRDEEDSLLPRLLEVEPHVEEVLRTMQTQHQSHESLLDRLVADLVALGESPGDPTLRANLHVVAQRFATEIEEHLRLEEETLFPWIDRSLKPEAQKQILDELRARRLNSFKV